MRALPLLFSLLLFFGCQERETPVSPQSEPAPPKVKPKEVYLSLADSAAFLTTNLFVDALQDKPDLITLGASANRATLRVPTQDSIRLIGGDPMVSFLYKLTLYRGDSLSIEIDPIELNNRKVVNYPVFSLAGSDRNWAELNFQYLLYKKNLSSGAIYIDPEGNFMANAYDNDQVLVDAIDLLDSLRSAGAISGQFYQKSLLTKQLEHASNKIRKASNASLDLNLAELGISLNDTNLLDKEAYISFLRTAILHQYFKGQRRVPMTEQFDLVSTQETFLKEATKIRVLDSYLKSIYLVDQPMFEEYLASFNQLNRETTLREKWRVIADNLSLRQEKLNNANFSSGMLTNLVDDRELTFEEVLKMHTGKVVLVDFWASWCSPCRVEMPALESLRTRFADEDFQIVEISIDKDFADWQRAARLEGLGDDPNSFLIADWQESSVFKHYKITTIPRYLLFDKAGKIIAEDAPRPREDRLVEMIRMNL